MRWVIALDEITHDTRSFVYSNVTTNNPSSRQTILCLIWRILWFSFVYVAAAARNIVANATEKHKKDSRINFQNISRT